MRINGETIKKNSTLSWHQKELLYNKYRDFEEDIEKDFVVLCWFEISKDYDLAQFNILLANEKQLSFYVTTHNNNLLLEGIQKTFSLDKYESWKVLRDDMIEVVEEFVKKNK